MAGSYGGITRAGVSGSYSYATIPGRENYPVNFVSFWDAARFANWLHNGQPTGPQNASTTEDGAYTLTPAGVAANSVTRNTGWQWAVTSSNEWYKAAYHQPAAQGGDADNYWMYPTSSNTAPTGFEANYLHSPPVPLPLNDIMPVASYGANYYGAHDMGGNVYEWSDSILAPPVRGPLWGGAFDNVAGWLTPANAYTPPPFTEREQVGFRIVQVPGPTAALVIGVVAGLGGARRRRLARTI
jgi:formylglycine-generating enzyme required for sulfatase activity